MKNVQNKIICKSKENYLKRFVWNRIFRHKFWHVCTKWRRITSKNRSTFCERVTVNAFINRMLRILRLTHYKFIFTDLFPLDAQRWYLNYLKVLQILESRKSRESRWILEPRNCKPALDWYCRFRQNSNTIWNNTFDFQLCIAQFVTYRVDTGRRLGINLHAVDFCTVQVAHEIARRFIISMFYILQKHAAGMLFIITDIRWPLYISWLVTLILLGALVVKHILWTSSNCK